MSTVDVDQRARVARTSQIHEKIGSFVLFGLLAAFTLTTLDGGDIAPRILCAITLLFAACYFAVPLEQQFTLSLPVVCLLLMTCFGVAQTLWSEQKIVYSGWSEVLFWLTAAIITVLAAQVFRSRDAASAFRLFFVMFGVAVCVLDLLEQASHTSKYFWLIQSKYQAVSGPFAYWNNFAQFVELALPLTLWLGVGRQKPVLSYLLLAAVQFGAVIASSSRAGSVLALIEVIAVLAMASRRHRSKSLLIASSSVLVLCLVFVYAAGSQKLDEKLRQRDQLAVRRDINKSSIAMIRARPLTGWGLETYVPVYRMFALYDDGTWVNRAHNDWLQWTAEGGIFFSGLMLAVFIWSIRPAIRSVWGIGVIAVCVHAAVDYPFARFGVCGWYFALIGMLASAQREHRNGIRRPSRHMRTSDYGRPAA